MQRLNHSMRELRLVWPGSGHFPSVAEELVKSNNLSSSPAMVYLQVTRGVARRTHNFPGADVRPTVYSYAWGFEPDLAAAANGIKVMLKEDIRWSRCNIKSIALLPNTLSFQEATEFGYKECIFVRNGLITEGSHSNFFAVIDGSLFTHPESNHILSGITRKNVLRIAVEAGIKVREEAIPENKLRLATEAFITNTSAEVTPVIEVGGNTIGTGIPGAITRLIRDQFTSENSSPR